MHSIPSNPMVSELIAPITSASWWQTAFERYDSALSRPATQRPLILYNADMDGFAASYFVFKSLQASSGGRAIQSRPVWNFEYDFRWLPNQLTSLNPDLLVCVDLPIIQEPAMLREAANKCPVIIYDHHVVPSNLPPPPGNVTFLNPRVLGLPSDNHPASAFTGAAAMTQNAIIRSELLLLAAGLKGDWALDKYPAVMEAMKQFAPSFAQSPLESHSPLARFTARINALFRARPGAQLPLLQSRLATLIATQPVERAIAIFADDFELERAAADTQREVNLYLDILTQDARSPSENGVFFAVPEVQTFSTGLIATLLAKRNVAPVVGIGFQAGDRVQFELRIAPQTRIDLTQVLQAQRAEFQALTSGGHPMASGALILKSDCRRFADTFRKALTRLYGLSSPSPANGKQFNRMNLQN